MVQTQKSREVRIQELAALYRQNDPLMARWAAGYEVIQHSPLTQVRVHAMTELLSARRIQGDGIPVFDLLYAADRVASAAMWLVVHMTYARNVYLGGRDLLPEDFKPDPEGHTGGRSIWSRPMSAI